VSNFRVARHHVPSSAWGNSHQGTPPHCGPSPASCPGYRTASAGWMPGGSALLWPSLPPGSPTVRRFPLASDTAAGEAPHFVPLSRNLLMDWRLCAHKKILARLTERARQCPTASRGDAPPQSSAPPEDARRVTGSGAQSRAGPTAGDSGQCSWAGRADWRPEPRMPVRWGMGYEDAPQQANGGYAAGVGKGV